MSIENFPSHTAKNTIYVSDYGDEQLERFKYYNNIATAISDAPVNSTVIIQPGLYLYNGITEALIFRAGIHYHLMAGAVIRLIGGSILGLSFESGSHISITGEGDFENYSTSSLINIDNSVDLKLECNSIKIYSSGTGIRFLAGTANIKVNYCKQMSDSATGLILETAVAENGTSKILAELGKVTGYNTLYAPNEVGSTYTTNSIVVQNTIFEVLSTATNNVFVIDSTAFDGGTVSEFVLKNCIIKNMKNDDEAGGIRTIENVPVLINTQIYVTNGSAESINTVDLKSANAVTNTTATITGSQTVGTLSVDAQFILY